MKDSKAAPRFLAGAGKAIITPKLGARLYGYATNRFGTEVHDDLTATALAFSDGTTSAALVTLTVCSIPDAICKRAEKMVEEATGIRHLILSATHTHSGPALTSTPGWGDADPDYIDNTFLPGLVKAVKEAADSMTEAKMGIATIESHTGINRRMYKLDGTVSLGQNPYGPYDPRMRVMTFVTPDESRTIGSLIHFGAHGTAAGGPYPESPITRDWSGVMTDRIEWLSDAPCLFLNAAIGDVAPRDFNRIKKHRDRGLNHIQQSMEIGGMAAVDASQAFSSIHTYFTPDLGVKTGRINLSYEPLPPLDVIRENLARLEGTDNPFEKYELNRWQKALEAADKEPETAFSYDQTLIRIGPAVFVPHPFEIFTLISLRLDHYSPVEYTLSLSNANGTNGYLPNKEEILRGGYEIWSSRYRYAYLLTQDADTELINQNLALIKEMEE